MLSIEISEACFDLPQPPVQIQEVDGYVYVYICLNQREKNDSHGGVQYIYDMCEFHDYALIVDVEDIKNRPEHYFSLAVENQKKDINNLKADMLKEILNDELLQKIILEAIENKEK